MEDQAEHNQDTIQEGGKKQGNLMQEEWDELEQLTNQGVNVEQHSLVLEEVQDTVQYVKKKLSKHKQGTIKNHHSEQPGATSSEFQPKQDKIREVLLSFSIGSHVFLLCKERGQRPWRSTLVKSMGVSSWRDGRNSLVGR